MKYFLQGKVRNFSLEKEIVDSKKREVEEMLERKEDTEEKLQKLAVRFNMLEEIESAYQFQTDINKVCLQAAFSTKLEEKRLECEKLFFKELEEDKMKWKQSSDEIIYDLM